MNKEKVKEGGRERKDVVGGRRIGGGGRRKMETKTNTRDFKSITSMNFLPARLIILCKSVVN